VPGNGSTGASSSVIPCRRCKDEKLKCILPEVPSGKKKKTGTAGDRSLAAPAGPPKTTQGQEPTHDEAAREIAKVYELLNHLRNEFLEKLDACTSKVGEQLSAAHKEITQIQTQSEALLDCQTTIMDRLGDIYEYVAGAGDDVPESGGLQFSA